MPSIAILALENCLLSGVVGPLEIFAIANEQAKQDHEITIKFDPVQLVGITPDTTLNFTGLPIPIHSHIAKASADIIIIPPIMADVQPIVNNTKIIHWIQQQHSSGSIIATCCAGAFLLAQTGILDGKPATTHWHLVDSFEQSYPDVDLQSQMMLIDGGHYICAGGAMAWQDLALHIISRFMNAEIASTTAKLLVMDGTRSAQTPYFMFNQQANAQDTQTEPGILEVQKWMQQNYQQQITLEDLAKIAQMGSRTFLRRFKATTGQTPLGYLQQLRIEAARHILEVSSKNIEEITALVGYSDSSAFRRLFKQKTSLTPKEYRDKFHRFQ